MATSTIKNSLIKSLLILCIVSNASIAWADNGIAIRLSFQQAVQRMLEVSNKLAAQSAAVQSATDKQTSIKYITGPKVKWSSTFIRYNFRDDIELQDLQNKFGTKLEYYHIPNKFNEYMATHIPDDIQLHTKNKKIKHSIIAYWPIYTGGKGKNSYELAGKVVQEQQAKLEQSVQEIYVDLVKYYYQVDLAQQVLLLTKKIEETMKQHNQTAQAMFDYGLIAKYELLQARAALADAKRNHEQAVDNLALAKLALSKILHLEQDIITVDKLFVGKKQLVDKQYFIKQAMINNSIFSTLSAKREQVIYSHKMNTSNRKPQVMAWGVGDVKDKNLMFGINLSWELFNSINRTAENNSNMKLIEQIDQTQEQASIDLSLLVEKNWLAVEQAHRQYIALNENINLAQEIQVLRLEGLKQGINTVQDLMEAETNLLQAKTKQLQVAYEYDLALVKLLESSGQAQNFIDYINAVN